MHQLAVTQHPDGGKETAPSWRVVLIGALTWGLAMGGGAALNLLREDWGGSTKVGVVSLLFAAGGALAFPIGLGLARRFGRGRSRKGAFVAAFFALLVATVAVTSALFVLHYRYYHAEQHAPLLSLLWMRHFAVTTAVTLYQFAVFGMRFYLPFGLAALLVASLWFARLPR